MHWNLSIAFSNTRNVAPMPHPPQRTYFRTPKLSLQRQWSLHIDYFYSYYSTTLDNINIFTSNKNKTPASINSVETFTNKKLTAKIQRLSTTNVQLITDKMETEKIKINLETDRIRLLNKKNSLIAKKEELRTEIAVLNITRLFNILVRSYQNPLLNQGRNKLKTKRLSPFNGKKKTL